MVLPAWPSLHSVHSQVLSVQVCLGVLNYSKYHNSPSSGILLCEVAARKLHSGVQTSLLLNSLRKGTDYLVLIFYGSLSYKLVPIYNYDLSISSA